MATDVKVVFPPLVTGRGERSWRGGARGVKFPLSQHSGVGKSEKVFISYFKSHNIIKA